MIPKQNLDNVNDFLIARDETFSLTHKNKKQTFETEKKQIGEFLPLPKCQTKHPTDCCAGATADLMRQWYRLKLSLEDIYDSKVDKCQERR